MSKKLAVIAVLLSLFLAGCDNFNFPLKTFIDNALGSSATPGYPPVTPEDRRNITNFAITYPLNATGNISGTAINVTVPFNTDPGIMSVEIAHTGASIRHDEGMPQTVSPAIFAGVDFRTPQAFTVTAINGETRTYTVTVRVTDGDISGDADITINFANFVNEAPNMEINAHGISFIDLWEGASIVITATGEGANVRWFFGETPIPATGAGLSPDGRTLTLNQESISLLAGADIIGRHRIRIEVEVPINGVPSPFIRTINFAIEL